MLAHINAWRAVPFNLANTILRWHRLPPFRYQEVGRKEQPEILHHLVCHEGEIFALNTALCRVYVFREDLTPVRRWSVSALGLASIALDLALSHDGHVLVLTNNGHIRQFHKDGTFVCDWTVPWLGCAELNCIAVYQTHVFVTEDYNTNVYVLSLSDGSVVRTWQSNAIAARMCITASGAVVLATQPPIVPHVDIGVEVRNEWGVLLYAWLVGQSCSYFSQPVDLALRGSTLFLARSDTNVIVTYDITGRELGSWGTGEVRQSIAATREGRIVVASTIAISVYK